jgi:hypothetical protein
MDIAANKEITGPGAWSMGQCANMGSVLFRIFRVSEIWRIYGTIHAAI